MHVCVCGGVSVVHPLMVCVCACVCVCVCAQRQCGASPYEHNVLSTPCDACVCVWCVCVCVCVRVCGVSVVHPLMNIKNVTPMMP